MGPSDQGRSPETALGIVTRERELPKSGKEA